MNNYVKMKQCKVNVCFYTKNKVMSILAIRKKKK